VIEVTALEKRFGNVTAVNGVSFTAGDGRVTGLLGPNGAGKTTTLRMMYGVMRPDRGGISVDGVDAARRPLDAQARVGVLPDVYGLYPRLTAREHIRYFGELQGLSRATLAERAEELFALLDMRHIADRRADGYSHGERTKVALARALVHRPQNVLLDEPTNGLDVMSTRAVRAIVRKLRAEGRCVLFSSHVMQEVSALCDTIVVVAGGRVVAQGSPDELRAQGGHENLEDAFVALAGTAAGGARR
jgi:sodium transport system ATP-binding protein